jgi:hypothetical protein
MNQEPPDDDILERFERVRIAREKKIQDHYRRKENERIYKQPEPEIGFDQLPPSDR